MKFVEGVFSTANHRSIKMHTTNDLKNPSFTLARQELKWFLGDFVKKGCITSNRKLALVIKEQGTWRGRLKVIYVEPKQLFNLLAKTNRSSKIKVDHLSIAFNVKKDEEKGKYYINRFNKNVQVEALSLESLSQ